MKKKALVVLIAVALGLGYLPAQQKSIPQWFLDDLSANIGTWVADNSAYKGEGEPFEAYKTEWEWGVGQTSIVGRLYAIQNGQEVGPFWEYRQYWDNLEQKGILVQHGPNGNLGIGEVKPLGSKMELIQVFSLSDGRTWEERHLMHITDGRLTTVNFEKKNDGSWSELRTYVWKKQDVPAVENPVELGTFSVSLTVKDIRKSYQYYQTLGFEEVDTPGSLEDKWILLQNGTTKIGLFEGMFDNNILTFNSKDARSIYKLLVGAGFKIESAEGMDKAEGPCNFVIMDPDGNLILFDQYL